MSEEGEITPRPERSRQLPRSTPALWIIVWGVWLLVAPREMLADPLPIFLMLAALFLTRWLVTERQPAGLCFLGWWLVGGGLAYRFTEESLRLALLAGTAGLALWLTARWNRPPWPELRVPGALLTAVGVAAALWFQFLDRG